MSSSAPDFVMPNTTSTFLSASCFLPSAFTSTTFTCRPSLSAKAAATSTSSPTMSPLEFVPP